MNQWAGVSGPARLGGFYFAYFAYLGAFTPYFSLYLDRLGLSALEISVVIALPQMVKVFAPALLGWLSDTRGARRPFILMSTLFTALSLAGLWFAQSFAAVCVVVLLMGIASSGTLPLVEATTMSTLGNHPERYGPVRMWGSVGFILAVLATGAVLDRWVSQALLPIVVSLSMGAALVAWSLPESAVKKTAHVSVTERARWFDARTIAFLGAAFCMTVAHGALYAFYSLYLVQHGYSKTMVGWLWTIGVLGEIVLFFFLPQVLRRWNLRTVLLAAFACAVLRFCLIGWCVESLAVLVFAQLLHAATFGAYHAAAIAAVHRLFTAERQVRGQALFSSLSYGLGGAVGMLLAGAVWASMGPTFSFSLCAGFALLGGVLVAWQVRFTG